jgi:hypothetical protein
MGFQPKQEIMAHVGGKVLIFGATGSGKSTIGGSFPKINLVDSEDGQTYYLENNPNILNVLRTTSATDVQEALDELNDEDVLKEFETILIDSGTKLYENMQASAYEIVEKRAKKQISKGISVDSEDLNLAQRDWGHIKRWNQQLKTAYILLSSMGKWVVEIAHQKDIMRDGTPDEKKKGVDRVKIGEAPDLAKKAEYDFDIIIQSYTVEDKDGIKYFGKILKDRTGVTQKGDIIENISFDIWKKKWESTKKYGVKKGLDLSQGVKKDSERMELEDNNLDDLRAEFKSLAGKLSDENKSKMLKESKRLEMTNPLKSDDVDALSQLVDFIKLLK